MHSINKHLILQEEMVVVQALVDLVHQEVLDLVEVHEHLQVLVLHQVLVHHLLHQHLLQQQVEQVMLMKLLILMDQFQPIHQMT